MKTISYSKARDKFSTVMEKVCEDHEPIIITRQKQQSVVMMSLDDYRSFEETFYLLKSQKNANRLNNAIKDFEKDKNFKKITI